MAWEVLEASTNSLEGLFGQPMGSNPLQVLGIDREITLKKIFKQIIMDELYLFQLYEG